MSLNLNKWVSAAGYLKKITRKSRDKFYDAEGVRIEQVISEIGERDPLIVVAPNHLRSPLMNPYALDYADNSNVPVTMSDPQIYGFSHISHSFSRHDIYDILARDDECTKDLRQHIHFKNGNPTWEKIRGTTITEFKQALESVTPLLIKKGFDKSLANKISGWLCDSFMTVERDPGSKDFICTGYFGIAMGLGAEYNIDRIKALVRELNPDKSKLGNNITAVQEYIKSSNLYKELSKTNRYLAATCVYNEYFNKSDPSRTEKYMQINGGYIDVLRELASRRDTIPAPQHDQFMRDASIMYYNATNVNDRNKYVSPKDEKYLKLIVDKLFDRVPYSTS